MPRGIRNPDTEDGRSNPEMAAYVKRLSDALWVQINREGWTGREAQEQFDIRYARLLWKYMPEQARGR